jgi:hypothetical protein
MVQVSWNERAGHPDDVISTLKRSVGQLTKKVGSFKIGRTCDPDARASARDYAKYDELIVIYKTTSAEHVNDVERELIEYFETHDDIGNFRGGGGGPLGRPPYYVYVVRSKTLLDSILSIFD